MSKKSKKKNKNRRDAQKRARREANRNMYAGIVGTAANRKNKNRKTAGSSSRKHPVSPCGNGACRRCYTTSENDPWMSPRSSCLYGKRWSSPLHRR